MSSSLIAASFASSSSFGYSAAFRASALTSDGSGTDATAAPSEVRKAHHHDHDQDDHGWHRGQRHGDDSQASGEAYGSLKIKIEQTFSSLLNASDGSTATSDAGADSTASFEGVFKASFRISGPDGTVEAKLKLKFEGDAAASGDDFKNALQGFTDALFSALRSMYGTPPAALPDTTPATTAAATTPAAVTALPATDAGASTPAVLPAATTATAAASPTPDSATTTDASVPAAPAPAPAPAPTGTPAAFSRSVTVKLRLTYDSFNDHVGGLVGQLAKPNVTEAFPGLSDTLDDLASQFDKLLSLAPGANGTPPTLGQFLTALSQAFGGNGSTNPQTPAAAAQTPALPAATTAATATTTPTDATAPTAGSVPNANPVADEVVDAPNLPATGAAAPAAPPSSGSIQRYTAMATYQQVLSYSDAQSSYTLQTSMRARAVYELA